MDAINLQQQVIKTAKEKGILPQIPEISKIPIPAIHKIEWDLTFRCNDRCKHCVTDSGPERKEFTTFSDAIKIIDNIAEHTLLKRVRDYFKDVEFCFKPPAKLKELENLENPPKELTDKLSRDYLDCLHGKNYDTTIKYNNTSKKISFGRPHIRLSGGEFFMWPYRSDNKILSYKKRLEKQSELLKEIRKKLPDYDIWILTNGRFATSQEKADEVIRCWTKNASPIDEQGKVRICISIDPFHKPPSSSTIEEMLSRIWKSCKKFNISSPFFYGIPGREIYYAGRAFSTMKTGDLKNFKDISGSKFNPINNYCVATNDLSNTGCNEVTGFSVKIDNNSMVLVNNINISPDGHLAFCCAQVGDYGDFVNDPVNTLRMLIAHPIAFMLRKKEFVVSFLNLVVEMDPTIKAYGVRRNAAVGSTCYQLLTGKRN